MRPGPNAANTTAPTSNTSPVSTATWFPVGPAAQGPTTPVLITNFAQYQKVFGGRGTFSATLSDSIEQFFLEGGARAYVTRVVGAAAVTASVVLKDSTAAASATVSALGAGTYGNAFTLTVGGTLETAYTITVKNATETLEVSPALSSLAELAAWGKLSAYVTVAVTGTKSPNVGGPFALTGGTDETAGITTAVYEAAFAKLLQEYGPGHLSAPGVSTSSVIEALYKYEALQKRLAVADLANAGKATLLTAAAVFRALTAVNRPGILLGDWQQAPPLPGTIAPRAVPLSAYFAAKAAVIDSLGNPNLPVAGKQAILPSSLGKEQVFTESELEELYLAGVNVCKVVNGQVRIYGCRTAVNPTTDPLYLQFNNVRLDMAITWKALAIEEQYMFSQEDGQGNDSSAYGSALAGMLLPLYTIGALFGKTPQEAFSVEAGPAVNTLATEEEGNLNATVSARRAKGADQVNYNFNRVPITQEV